MRLFAFVAGIKNFLITVLVFILMLVMPSYYFDSKEMVDGITGDTFKSAQTTLAYGSNGEVIAKFKDEKDSYYVSYENIPDTVKEAFIATEDKAFFEHNGVDLNGLGRAFFNLIKNGEISGGGSTITQQLTRNVFLTHEKSLERKVKEIFISYMLEKRYSKEEILEFYVNSIYYSNGVYGIDSASRKYFGRPVQDLNLAEVSFLCAIPNNPTLYNPLKNYDNTIKRQKRILGYMLEDGYITEEERQAAEATEIILTPENIESSSFVNTYIMDCVTDIIVELNGFEFKSEFVDDNDKKIYNEKLSEARKKAQNEMYTSGYRIYTSIDMSKQQSLQNSVNEVLSANQELGDGGVYSFQGAATSIDNNTGKVVAIVGGREQDGVVTSFNRAFQSYRQPGSIAKPLVVYAPAFEKGYYPSSLFIDEKSENGPKNYDEQYEGIITLRQAVQKSKNTVAWNLFRTVTPEDGLGRLKKMNFKKIVEEDYNLASALGGFTHGVSSVEMCSAYATLARDGMYVKPTCILKITDASGKVIYEDNSLENQSRVYEEKASRIMTDVLRTTMIEGTGANLQLEGMVSAGKTGSTNQSKDGWFAGYTPYYTTVVWVGHDKPKAVNDLYGSTYPGRVWQRYMNEIHQGLEYKEFPRYFNLEAEEEALRGQEEQKRLEYEIRRDIDAYVSYGIYSYENIMYSETMYWGLTQRIESLWDEYKRNEFYEKIRPTKEYVDGQKPIYGYY